MKNLRKFITIFSAGLSLAFALVASPSIAGVGPLAQRTAIYKADSSAPALKKVSGAVYIRAGVEVDYAGQTCSSATDVPVTLPTLVAGTDYRVVVKTDCTFQAYTYADTLPAGVFVIGGFHYLPGGYPADYGLGGDNTPTVLEWSFWDLNMRPSCPDPRGMTRIGSSNVWIDIYFQGNSSNADGVSRNNDYILTGTNTPLRAADYGGNTVSHYSTMTWWEANEHLRQWGKRLPTYAEMSTAAFGTNEKAGRGAHPVNTGLNTFNHPDGSSSDANFTSKFGLIQATGVLWIWTADLSDWQGTPTSNAWGWEAYDVTQGRGKAILQTSDDLTALLFGASYVYQLSTSPTGVAAVAGSRAVETIEKLWDSSQSIAIRGACNSYIRY